jgi:hypothetical protein
MFGRWFRPSSGALDSIYSLWYNAPTMLPDGSLEAESLLFQTIGRQHRGCIIPQAVNTVYCSWRRAKSSPKHVELIGIINKPLLFHLVGCLHYLFQWCMVKQIPKWIFKMICPSLSEGNVDKMLVNIRYKALSSVKNLLDNTASRPKNLFFFKKPEIFRIFCL